MLSKRISKVSALMCLIALPMYAGCSCGNSRTASATRTTPAAYKPAPVAAAPKSEPAPQAVASADFPSDAVAGECYGKVYVPPQMQTVEERVMIREASERHEIIPARYEWVEEQVLVKEAGTLLIEEPAQYKTETKTVEVTPAQTLWVMDSTGRCRTEGGQPAKDVFCLVNRPPVTKTVTTNSLAKACVCKTVAVPAEYTTVRRQKLVAPAITKAIPVPAEYENVQRTLVAAPGRWEWQRVICDIENSPTTLNDVKRALMAAGYKTGPLNGELTAQDWTAIRSYQEKNGLGIGELSYQTLDRLQVSAK